MGPGAELRDLFWTRRLVVLDFDGPITRLLPDPRHIELADRVKSLVTSSGVALPPDVIGCTDHVQVLRHAAAAHPALVADVEALCSDAELLAADSAVPAAGAVEVIDRLREKGRRVAIVTNNDPRVVERFARHRRLDLSGVSVHGREPGHPDRLKPAPWMLLAALRVNGCEATEALLVGDTASDVTAAAAAGMPCIGTTSGQEQAATLLAAGAVGVVPDLSALR